MKRMSARISAAVGGIRCPECRNYVVPTPATGDDTLPGNDLDDSHTGTGKRWSFVWRPPSGNVCPKCSFPMDRYAYRLKWIRIFRAAVALLVVGLVLVIVNRYADLPSWMVTLYKGIGIVGSAAFLVGGIGMIVGGRHD